MPERDLRRGLAASDATYAAVLAENIRSERARLNMTQRELSNRMADLGFTWVYQTVGKVENSLRPLLATEIVGLAVALEVTISSLMTPRGPQRIVSLIGDVSLTSYEIGELTHGNYLTTLMNALWREA